MYPSSYSVTQSLGGNPAQLGKIKTKNIVKSKSGNKLARSIWCRLKKKRQYLSLFLFHYYNDNPELHSFSSAYLFSWNYRPGKLTKFDAISHICCYLFSGINTYRKIDHHGAPDAQSHRNADLIIPSLNLLQTNTQGYVRQLLANKSKRAKLY